MEIQKVFSNVENPEENLYSVLMTEDEVALFSEFQKEFNSKVQKALRKSLDIKKGLGNLRNPYSLARERELMAQYFPERVKDVERKALRLGRRSNRSVIDPYRKNIHDKINYRDSAKKLNKSGLFKFELDPNSI